MENHDCQHEKEPEKISRRTLLLRGGMAAFFLALLAQGYAMLRSLVPNVLYEPPQRVKVGKPTDFDVGHTFLNQHNIFLFREQDNFYTISSICTHLGCNVKSEPLSRPRKIERKGITTLENFEFACPCHGSYFHSDGTVIKGPAPKPLPRFKVELSPKDGQLVIDMGAVVDNDFRLQVKS